MDLLDIIETRIQKKRKSSTSNKDDFFFHFLNKNEMQNLIIENFSSTMDEICYTSFVNSQNNVSGLVTKIQGEQPVMGLHYTKNLVELIAMSLQDYQFEEKNLIEYLNKCSLKEQYIIAQVFPKLDFNTKKAENSIEQVIANDLLTDSPPLSLDGIIDALSESKDLLDLFIIKSAFKRVYSFHPNKQLEQDLSSFLLVHQKLSDYQLNKYKHTFNCLLVILTITTVVFISFFIITYWDTFSIEPIYTAIGIVAAIISIVTPIIYRKKILSLKDYFDSKAEKCAHQWYSNKLQLNKSNLDKMIARRLDKLK